jgi:hypothetical protein
LFWRALRCLVDGGVWGVGRARAGRASRASSTCGWSGTPRPAWARGSASCSSTPKPPPWRRLVCTGLSSSAVAVVARRPVGGGARSASCACSAPQPRRQRRPPKVGTSASDTAEPWASRSAAAAAAVAAARRSVGVGVGAGAGAERLDAGLQRQGLVGGQRRGRGSRVRRVMCRRRCWGAKEVGQEGTHSKGREGRRGKQQNANRHSPLSVHSRISPSW